MTRALLIVPHFWDPVCVPLGVASLRAYAVRAGHEAILFDFNTVPEVFQAQRLYFEEVKRQLPEWRQWNIERNGTEALAMHQMLYLHARARPDYRELVAEVLNIADVPLDTVAARINVAPFDAIFSALYARVLRILEQLLEDVQPDVIGCSLFNSTWAATLFLLRRAKTLRPQARTVVGGPGPVMGIAADVQEVTAFYESHSFIDYYVVGEGERAFMRVLDEPDLPLGVIAPSSLKTADTSEVSSIRMVDIPDPDYGELDIASYMQLSIASSRGCPFACSFCAETIFWDGFRRNDATATAEQMIRLAKRYGRRSFYLCDSLANPVIDGISTALLASGEQMQFDAYLRADKSCLKPERAARWHDAGLFRARLGMESASQRILDDMVKMTTPAIMAQALRALTSGGVRTSTLWIVGYANETASEFEDTLAYIREHRDHIFDADAWLFQYHRTGLAGSSKLEGHTGSKPRFSRELTGILGVDAHVIDDGMSPGDRCDRLARFVSHMAEQGIPNPYSMAEWRQADERWSALGYRSRPGLGAL
ncbi:B12-binding domain-containing radical SAM protein [Pseudomonas khavaziana]|uniref:Cobalamin-dependent protein n=1 Tax=Pseudomonas khavaziana TaxID=2842351 RepID=A0ABZ2DF31_9PSED